MIRRKNKINSEELIKKRVGSNIQTIIHKNYKKEISIFTN
jgi:hypothetical protein